ncbi:hypothetical protein HanRHA438_Chr10g0443891 [Helianthus annuus]|uniref:Uncharacterized protein n=1 Tax=Helianthus annuus TaxID=4232 RepID=A0A9K3HW99_HELAN|nr:hypothetical protein HanXRQr2_Chr10g0431401 [Helianthus annuus]KAJ0513193.1 hypothetical protein HanHA300_Chr10g0354731 [Helianthus annuus]KAJ0520949.1 hypothetical protein HanIR_Chr10g0465201 [Helianthus annuus]KAJ0529317.1 hypothetical protein HanHA89_Chr10g0376421 [Helianthus annuus]KAJ0696202.1 hypothetical protein HanLR1_Chr10g0354311 [Helianthus annuus]
MIYVCSSSRKILTENSYLNIYGCMMLISTASNLRLLQDFVSGEMLLLVQKMKVPVIYCQTKFLLKLVLLKLVMHKAKQMPVTTEKLRHLLKSRHPYIERNLGSIVGITKHSMQNGAAFELVAKKIVEDDYLTRMKIVKEIHEHN